MRPSKLLLAGLLLATGCWNYRQQLERADEHYQSARYEAAITNLEDLDPSLNQLDPSERAQATYLQGMSHHRLGHRADARHWLASTREMLEHGASLPDDRRDELTRTLAEIDWVNRARESNGTTEAAAAPSIPSGTEPLDVTPRAATNARPRAR